MASLACRCIASLKAGGNHEVQVVTLPDGEQYKSLEVLQQVWDKALQSRLDRNSTFVALGGGVIGDMCGFAASAYQRGVHFIQVSPSACQSVPCTRTHCVETHLLVLLHAVSTHPGDLHSHVASIGTQPASCLNGQLGSNACILQLCCETHGQSFLPCKHQLSTM